VLEDRQQPEDAPTLAQAVRTGTGPQKAVALRGLRALGNASVLDEAVALVRDTEHGRCRRIALSYIASLSPKLTLERARRWVQEPWPLPLAGWEVLKHHAIRDDLDLLRDALATASKQQDMYTACFAVDAMGCFAAPEAHAELRHFYASTPYAYGRWRVARALSRFEKDFSTTTAVECLYDCEPKGRSLGISFSDRQQAGVGERIKQIASDTAEAPEVAALAREGATGPST
jgi:hypothetical protein